MILEFENMATGLFDLENNNEMRKIREIIDQNEFLRKLYLDFLFD